MAINPDKTKIILVGNSIFPDWNAGDKNGEDKSIPNVDKNINSLTDIFINDKFFGIPKDSRHLVTIQNETSQQILLRVKHETEADRGQFERLIFYYAGHGIPGEERKLFFASKETIRKDYEITSVDSERLFSYLNRFGANELIVILDCCYAAQSKENLGDDDSLIEKSLPKEKNAKEVPEKGTYYLFASDKDNVAKFNPREPETPTYFTMALLNSMNLGTEAGIAFIEIGELFKSLQNEITELKKTTGTEIPSPRPILVGDVKSFLFCKNVKFENQEDKDWAELKKDANIKKLMAFEDKYPVTRFESEKDVLRNRLITGLNAIKRMQQSNDLQLATQIKSEYNDIPLLRDVANKFMRDLAATAINDENEIEKEVFNSRKATDFNPDQALKQASSSFQSIAEAANQIAPDLRNNARTEDRTKR